MRTNRQMTRRTEIVLRYVGVYLGEVVLLAAVGRLLVGFLPSSRFWIVVSLGVLLGILTAAAIVVFSREWARQNEQ
jgi:hypothetical protein